MIQIGKKHCANKQNHNCDLIVLTGGPGAGKTAVLEILHRQLCESVAILPEAASIIFGGSFWRLSSGSAKMAAQKAIFFVQREMENLVIAEKSWLIGLCDRGTLDGLAYWPQKEQSYWQTFATTREREYAKYKAVFHLRTPSLEQGYNYQNPVRNESVEEAQNIDMRIAQVWKEHPNYFVIDSADSFVEKANSACKKIIDFIPPCCRHK